MKKAIQMGDLKYPETLRRHLKKLIDWKTRVLRGLRPAADQP